MTRISVAALALLLLLPVPAVAQDAPVAERSTEFQLLLGADSFNGSRTGYSGSESVAVVALRMILARPAAEARALLLRLVEGAEAGGQLYGLCGLYVLDRPLFQEKVVPFLTDTREIEFCSVGCDVNLAKVRDAVRSRSRWAVRLPEEWANPNWLVWVKKQSWPREAFAEPDIFGGAFPVELARHPGFLAARSPEGTIEGWLKRIGAEDTEPDEVGGALARFGGPGLEAARRLVRSKDPLARQVAAEVISSMGPRALGFESEDAAKLIAPLLLDGDDEVARAAANSLSALAPWNRAAKPYVLKALEGLPERVGDKPSGALIDYAEGLMRSLAWSVGPQAVPALAAMLSVSDEDLRCTAGCAIQDFGPAGVAAGQALVQALRRGDTPCVIETLGVTGVEPGSPEVHSILAILRGEPLQPSAVPGGVADPPISDPVEAAEFAAEVARDGFVRAVRILGALGPRAGVQVRREIQAALQQHRDCPSRVAELSLARWRISGQSEGLVERLFAAEEVNELIKVLRKSPSILPQLEPILRRGGDDSDLALEALYVLGDKARSLSPVLREVVAGIPLSDARAERAGRSLYEVCGDSSYLLRYMAWALEHETERALKRLPRMQEWALALPLIDKLKELVAASKGDRQESALEALRSFGAAAEAQLVPYFEGLHASEEFASIVPHLLGSLARDGSRSAVAALRRIVAKEGETKEPTYAQLELNEVWRTDE